MAVTKCPLCGSRLLNGICGECGYSLPDETEISSMYNYDPDDDEFGEKEDFVTSEADSGVMPAVREEVDRNFRNPYDYRRAPKIETVQKNNVQIQPQQNNANPYANFSPVQNRQQTPVKNTFNNNASSNADPAFVKDVVIGVILSMVFSLLGIIYGVRFIKRYNSTKDNKYLYAGIGILIMSIIGFIF